MPVQVNTRSPVIVHAERMARIDDRLERLQAQISRGERFTEPAENPAAARRAAMLTRQLGQQDADARVLERAATRLALAELAVGQGIDLLVRARELALMGATATMGPADRAVLAVEARALMAQLIDTANRRDEAGRHIFAGAADAQPAYTLDAEGQPVWQGYGLGPGAGAAGVAGAEVPLGRSLFGDAEAGALASMASLIAGLGLDDDAERQSALAGTLQGLEAGHEQLVLGQAGIGAQRARLESEEERVAAARLETQAGLASTQGLDLAAAFAELEALRLTLQASQQVFARLNASTLFDRLG